MTPPGPVEGHSRTLAQATAAAHRVLTADRVAYQREVAGVRELHTRRFR